MSEYITEKCLNIIHATLADIHLYINTHIFCQAITQPNKWLLDMKQVICHKKKKHDHCMVNSQLYQLKITIVYILNNIIIVNKIDNRLNMQ